jgi:hypothetical protein
VSVVSDIRDGIVANLNAAHPTLRCHASVPTALAPPAAVVAPVRIDYDATFGGMNSDFEFVVAVYLSRASERTAQSALDAYLDPTGSGSLKAAIEAEPTLGGAAHFVHVGEAREYGIVEIGGQTYLSAELGLIVAT